MKNFLIFSLFLLCALPVAADETPAEKMPNAEAEVIKEINQPATETVEPIVYKVEKKILPLPECDDEKLLAKTKEFITAYYAKSNNKGVLFRRRSHFLLNNLDKFSKENVANYKSEATRPVSDEIVNLLMNENILEENMRLCKKQAGEKISNDVYLLIYPFEQSYKVHILNLDKRHPNEKNIFVY